MAELNILDSPELSPLPLPARYLQIPTVIVNWLQNYFSQSQHRWLPPIADLKYFGADAIDKTEQLETAIEIRRLEEYPGDKLTKHRKYLVKRNAFTTRQSGLGRGQRMVGRTQSLGPLYATTYAGRVVIFACSTAPGESEFLAAEAEQLFNHYGQRIRQCLLLSSFDVSQVGDIGKISELPGFFVTPVVLDYIYEDNVEVSASKFPIRNINLDIK